MERAEFMARAMIALGTTEEHWDEVDSAGNRVTHFQMRDPKECAARARSLWLEYQAAHKRGEW